MGELNGNGHKITGLWINRSGHVGFFYKTHKAKLKNLTLSYSRASASSNGYFGSLAAKDSCSYIENIKISGTSVSGKNRVGGCIGYAYKDTLLFLVYITGKMEYSPCQFLNIAMDCPKV